MSEMWETIPSEKTFKRTKNFDKLCSWKTDLRADRKKVQEEQAMGAAADGQSRDPTSLVGGG